MKIALIVNLSKEKAIECAKQITELMVKNELCVLMLSECEQYYKNLKINYYNTPSQLIENCDYAITVGGDGTIIHAAKYAAKYDKPLIGVNVGRLGFAADVEPEEISKLLRLVSKDYTIQERMLLNIQVDKNGEISNYIAVNDAIIARGQLSKIIDLHLSLDGKEISTYRADGLLFSTPTGSTAYSLSAGGPIIEPQMNCILLTPICPHSLFSRSVLFSDSSVLSLKVQIPSDCSCVLTVDGEKNVDILADDTVTIEKSRLKLKLITLHKRNFYTLLNEKLKEREM